MFQLQPSYLSVYELPLHYNNVIKLITIKRLNKITVFVFIKYEKEISSFIFFQR